jgi:hypothetical protein
MPYQQVTLAQLLEQLESSYESAPFWTRPQAIRYINQMLRLWNLLTGTWKQKVLVASPSPSSPYVVIPGSLTYSTQVVWGPTGQPLRPTSLAELDAGAPRWEEATGVPTLWAPVGLTLIAVYPADPTGGLPFLIDGVARTPTLAALTDFVDLGSQDATAIAHGALYPASFLRGAAALKAAEPYMREFVEAARQQNSRLSSSSYYRKFLGLDDGMANREVVPRAPSQGGA